MYQEDSALNNLQGLIYHKIKHFFKSMNDQKHYIYFFMLLNSWKIFNSHMTLFLFVPLWASVEKYYPMKNHIKKDKKQTLKKYNLDKILFFI